MCDSSRLRRFGRNSRFCYVNAVRFCVGEIGGRDSLRFSRLEKMYTCNFCDEFFCAANDWKSCGYSACVMTMPLTLRLLQKIFPDYPGLMFGLAAGCLVPGYFLKEYFAVSPYVMTVIQFLSLFAAGLIYVHNCDFYGID